MCCSPRPNRRGPLRHRHAGQAPGRRRRGNRGRQGQNATTRQLQLLSTRSFPVVYSHNARSCSSGTFSANVTIGPNNTGVLRTIAFSLAASEASVHADDPFYVSLARTVAVKNVGTHNDRPTHRGCVVDAPAPYPELELVGVLNHRGAVHRGKGDLHGAERNAGHSVLRPGGRVGGCRRSQQCRHFPDPGGGGRVQRPFQPERFRPAGLVEILPAAETDITTVTVKAGDSITVTLWQVSTSSWEINLTDNTNGESYTTPPGAIQRSRF